MNIYRCLIQIFVSDFNKSLEWYQEKLGMELIDRFDEWRLATMRLAGVDYDICQPIPKWGSNWIKAKNNIGELRGIFFYTRNIDQTYQELKAKEVKFTQSLFETP